MSVASPSAAAAEPLGPKFPLFWISRVFSSFAYQISSVIAGWYVYDRTRNPFDLGYLGLCQFIAMVLLTFIAGNVADLIDRRRIVVCCQFIEAVTLFTMSLLADMHQLTVPLVFAAMSILGGCRAFENPTLSSFLPALVPQSVLPRAIALSSTAGQTATILGPSAGGLLYALGVRVPLDCASVLYLIASACAFCIKAERQPPRKEPMTLRSFFSGLSFVWSRPAILGVISLDLFAVLLGGATALLPIYARDILHTSAFGLGLLRSAPAVGAVIVSTTLSRLSLGARVGMKMFVSVIIFGVATIVFAASKNLALSLFALLILGAADNVSVVIRSSLVQLSTPDNMRGRVNATNSLFIGTSNQLGEFESGVTAGWFGPVAAGIIGGVGTIIVCLLWMKIFPVLTSLNDLASVQPEPATPQEAS